MSKTEDEISLMFSMLYCDSNSCWVNTFEYGDTGKCPGCNSEGVPLR